MNGPSLEKFEGRVKKGGRIILNSSLVTKEVTRTDIEVIKVPINEIALELGNAKVANMVMLGAYLKVLNIFNNEDIIKVLMKLFGDGKAQLIDVNKIRLNNPEDILDLFNIVISMIDRIITFVKVGRYTEREAIVVYKRRINIIEFGLGIQNSNLPENS